MTDVADNADDADRVRSAGSGCEGAICIWNPETLADRIFIAECELRHHVVNHNYELTALAIVIVEEAAFQQGDAHHL